MIWHTLFKNSCTLPNNFHSICSFKKYKTRKTPDSFNISSMNPTAGFLFFEHYMKSKIKAAQRNKQTKNPSVQGTDCI